MALDKLLFTNWVNGQEFTSRDYVYERDLVINYVNTLATLTQLNAGYLDGRYYTQTLLDNGQLDTRYYTQTLIDALVGNITDNVSDLLDGTQPAAKATADAAGNVITTTYETIANVDVIRGNVDQDVSIGSNPLFNQPQVATLELRDGATGHTTELSYDDANAQLKFAGETSGDETFEYGIDQSLKTTDTPEFVGVDLYDASGNATITFDGTRVVASYDGINLELGENSLFVIKASAPISEGQVIMFTGTNGASGKLLGEPATKEVLNTTPSYVMGIATEDASTNGSCRINAFGQVNVPSQLVINGTPSASGILYFDSTSATAGQLTYDKPIAPNVQIELCALVYQNPSKTILQVRPHIGYTLGNLHDVYTNGGLVVGDILVYDDVDNRWENINFLETGNTQIKSSFLPSYVDDVLEYADFASLPATGESGKLYVTLDDNATYRWSGSIYVSTMGTAEQTMASATNFGKLFKDAGITNVQEALDFIDDNVAPAFDGEPNGFIDRDEVTFSVNYATRTLTLTGTYSFYVNGIKYTKTNDTYQWSNVEGAHYIYYNNSGVLTETMTFNDDLIQRFCFVQYLYWDLTNQTAVPNLLVETHGVEMPAEVHSYLHRNEKTSFVSGLSLTLDATGNGSLDSHAQLSSSLGRIDDEDIPHTILAKALGNVIPVMYRDGLTWKVDRANSFPVINSGTGRASYNDFNGGDWQVVEVDNLKYTLAHIYAVPGLNYTQGNLVTIMGQAQYNTVSDARQGAEEEASSIIINDLPVSELLLVGTIICQTASVYANTPKTRFIQTDTGADYIDWRFSKPKFTGGITASQWGTITGEITDQTDLIALIDANTTVLYTDEYEILTTNGTTSFTYSKNGGVSTAGTISGGFYIFPDLTGYYKINSSRIEGVKNNDLTYFTVDSELSEGVGDVDNNTQEVQVSGLIANDTIVFKYYQGNDVVALNIGNDTVGRTELTAAVEAELDASITHQGNTSNPHVVTVAQIGAVPTARTIAGIDLVDDVTISELKIAQSLNNVDNTTDANKPVSTATQTLVDTVKGVGWTNQTVKANADNIITILEALEFNDIYGGI